MPVMAYCKKCKQEVEPGSLCPLCGQKLAASSLRLSWTYRYAPVREFLSWNSIFRVALPVLALLLMLVVGVEWGRKGFLGVQALLAQGLLSLLLLLAAAMVLAAFAALLMRGREEIRYILDGKGVHVQVFRAKPSLAERLFRTGQMDAEAAMQGQPGRMLEEKHIPWIALRRVELWPDRDKILLYSPRFWLCISLHGLPETYDDAVRFIYEHVKKRSGVMKTPPASGETLPPQM